MRELGGKEEMTGEKTFLLSSSLGFRCSMKEMNFYGRFYRNGGEYGKYSLPIGKTNGDIDMIL